MLLRRVGTCWWFGLMCLVVFAAGCPDDENGGGDVGGDTTAADTASDSDGDTAESDTDEGETQICEPGELIRCGQENSPSIVVCNEAGTETEPGTCPDSHVCREGECVEVNCIPGEGRCVDGVPETCGSRGEEWNAGEACEGDATCAAGRCLNRCEIAAKTNSYIGCEYWAAELENHLLYEERESGRPIPDDELPPFGVVLANTSDDYTAKVTVWKDPETPATAIPSRKVGTDIQTPDLNKETVHSELVNANGDRLLGPIDRDLVEVPIPEQSMLTLILPNHQIPDGETSLQDTAYRIESSEPIVAYQFNPYCCNYNYTNDASLLMPTSALSGNYMYMSYPVWDAPNREEGDEPESATITVVATKPDTDVSVQLREPNNEERDYTDIIYPIEADRISGPTDDGELTVTMEPFEVLNIAARGVGEDLTGARIEADEPISTFGAHSCTFVPFSKWACDHLESQLFPMETWGDRYFVTPLKKRGPEGEFSREGTYWKFLAREDDTVIETGLNLELGPDGVLPQAGEGVPPCQEFSPNPKSGVIELDAGESCEFGTQTSFVAEASDPVLLGAFLSGQQSVGDDVEHAGDPAFFLVPPNVQYRTDYSFLTPETYFVNYVTVSMQSGLKTLTLDGREIDVTELDSYKEFPDLGIARAHIEVEAGPHRISSNTVPFGLVAYGYDDYVSYAYTGGLDLIKRDQID